MAYRFCLAECVRRKAWQELYTAQAARLADHMAKVRDKEVGKREAFRQQVGRCACAWVSGRRVCLWVSGRSVCSYIPSLQEPARDKEVGKREAFRQQVCVRGAHACAS